jgi:hypothetical protein
MIVRLPGAFAPGRAGAEEQPDSEHSEDGA